MAWVGNILTHMGEYDRGCALTERAMTLNPAHPGWLHFAMFNRHFGRGEYEHALRAARRSNMPQFFWMHMAIAAAAGQAGRVMEEREAAEQMTTLAPFLADDEQLRDFVTRWYWDEDVIERLLEGITLSKAAGTEQQPLPSTARSGVTSAKPPSSSSVRRQAQHDLLSIAIAPFSARSTDDESRALAEGLTDDIPVLLSKCGNLRVSGRSASGSSRFVLEGQVRRSGRMVRIGATLIDARAALNALRAIDPSLTEPENAREVWARWHWSEERIAQLVDGLRKAVQLDAQR